MKLDKTYLLQKLSFIITFIKRYRFILAFVVFTSLYAYVLVQVNNITAREPSETAIQAKATAAPKTRVDKELVQQIEQLEEQNVQVKTIFSEARKNPFSEN